jgi:hypothetical protein
MITILEINLEISKEENRLSACGEEIKKADKEKILSRIIFLRQAGIYIQQSDRAGFINSECLRLINRIRLIKSGFKDWIPERKYKSEKAKLKSYLNECGVPKLNEQLKAIKYILQKK